MIVEFDKSFEKSLSKLKDPVLFARIVKLIDAFERAENLGDVANVKKLVGFKTYYRCRIGLYRLGFELLNEKTIRFIIIAHRKDIYTKFP